MRFLTEVDVLLQVHTFPNITLWPASSGGGGGWGEKCEPVDIQHPCKYIFYITCMESYNNFKQTIKPKNFHCDQNALFWREVNKVTEVEKGWIQSNKLQRGHNKFKGVYTTVA